MTRIILEGRQVIKPLDNIPVSAWAEKNRILKHGSTSRPGKWKNSLVPYMVEVMDSVTDPEVDEITVMSSAQISKTEVLMCILGRTIDKDPCPIMIVFPTIDAARKFSKNKLNPMIRDTKCLFEKVSKEKSRNADNSILEKSFEGGFLIIVGANSPNALASHSIKMVLSDDVDRMPLEVGDEGDPLALAEKRTTTYEELGAKKIAFSTPTIEETSRIKKKYKLSDKSQYHVPCPACGKLQTLKFENLQWDKEPLDAFGDEMRHLPETAKYACEKCGYLIAEKEKFDMLQKGIWISESPGKKRHRGFWINELYSMFTPWKKIVEKYLDAKNNPEKMIVFENTSLARTVSLEESKEIDETGFMSRVEDYILANDLYTIPDEVLLLTCFVDVQNDRLEYMVRGWGMDEESWDIQYDRIYGDPEQDDVWKELDYVLERKWKRRDGVMLGIRTTLVDSGYLANRVYEYTRPREHRNVFASKGKDGYGRSIIPKMYSEQGKPVTKLWILGVDTAKQTVFNRLTITQKGPRCIHFSRLFSDQDYFKSLLSEKRVVKRTKTGAPYIAWVKKSLHQPNEVWDLHVGNLAAMKLTVPNFKSLKESRDRQALEIQQRAEVETREVEVNKNIDNEQVQPKPKTRRRFQIGSFSSHNF